MAEETKKKSWFGRHKILTGVGILVVLGIIASAAGGSKTNTSSKSNDSSGGTTASTQSKAKAMAKVGEAASDGKFQFTVTSIKCGNPSVSDSTGYLTKTAQGQYCLLAMDVKNVGNEAQTLDSSSQYLFNASGQKYSADSEASFDANPSGSTFLNSINPGNTASGIFVFDVPKDQTPVTAELHDSAFSGGVKVNLQ